MRRSSPFRRVACVTPTFHYKVGAINDEFPFLLGHEAAGVVEAVGEDVTEIEPGDFVILAWRAPCGECRSCRRGRPWYCFESANAIQPMTLSDGTPLSPALGIGALASKTLVAAGQAIKVNAGRAAPTAGLIGCGVMAGLGAAMYTGRRLARRLGCGVRVRGSGGRGHPRRQARRCGEDHRGRYRSHQARLGQGVRRDAHRRCFQGRPGRGREGVNRRLRRGRDHRGGGTSRGHEAGFLPRDLAGTLVQAGVPNPTMMIELPMIEFYARGGALKPAWYGDCLPTRDFPMLIDLYLQGRLDLDRFVSERIGLDAVEDAFRKMEDGEVLRSVVVINP